jgi:hypothetical protein
MNGYNAYAYPAQTLKRKQEPTPMGGLFATPTNSNNNKRQKTPPPAPIQTWYESDRSYDDDKAGAFAPPASPVGLRTCMVPLTWEETKKMRGWAWRSATSGRKGVRARKVPAEGCTSPRGGKYRF